MKDNIIKASLVIEQIVKKTNRDKYDYIRFLSLVNQGVNPFSIDEINLVTTPENWAKLLKEIKK